MTLGPLLAEKRPFFYPDRPIQAERSVVGCCVPPSDPIFLQNRSPFPPQIYPHLYIWAPVTRMEHHYDRNIGELTKIFSFLEEAASVLSLDQATTFALNMVVEELYTNMVKYNGNGEEDILVGVDLEGENLVIRLIDFDSEPFDYSDQTEVDISAPLHERTPGGLGIHLVKRFMDEVSYNYKDRKTSIRLVKRLNTHA